MTRPPSPAGLTRRLLGMGLAGLALPMTSQPGLVDTANAFAEEYNRWIVIVGATPPGAVDVKAYQQWPSVRRAWGQFEQVVRQYLRR